MKTLSFLLGVLAGAAGVRLVKAWLLDLDAAIERLFAGEPR